MQPEVINYEKLYLTLNRFVVLSSQQQANVRELLKYQECSENHLLLKEGEIANSFYFIVEGVIRQYYNVEDREITERFAVEDDFVCSLYSFLLRKPSRENISSISKCKFLSLSNEGLQYLYDSDPVWNKVVRLLMEKHFIELEERSFLLKAQTAPERYDDLMQRKPDLIDRVKLGHIASYLGITQETLSRVRARYRNRQRIRKQSSEI